MKIKLQWDLSWYSFGLINSDLLQTFCYPVLILVFVSVSEGAVSRSDSFLDASHAEDTFQSLSWTMSDLIPTPYVAIRGSKLEL